MMSFHDAVVYVSMTKDGYFALETLLEAGKKIDSVITLAGDRAATVSDYADFGDLCTRYGVECLPVGSIRDIESRLITERPKIIFVNGWSELFREDLLSATKLGCVGTHPALLPKNRGRAPIPWHFLNKEAKGGLTLFYLDSGCDSGPIIDQREFSLTKEDNASSYYAKITQLGAELLLRHFDSLIVRRVPAVAQDESRATYLLKRIPADSWLDFTRASEDLCAQIRAVATIYPPAFFFYEGSKILVSKGDAPDDARRYSGVPGQIAAVSQTSVRLVTGDGVVDLSGFLSESGEQSALPQTFKVGRRVNQLERHYV